MILVVGATGLVGSEICGQLAARGKQVRALVRATTDPAKVDRLRALGAEIALGNLRDHASLDVACRGVETVITTASSMPFGYVPGVNDIRTTDLDGELSLVDAAQAAKVRHFIYTSFTMDLDFPLATPSAPWRSISSRAVWCTPSCALASSWKSGSARRSASMPPMPRL